MKLKNVYLLIVALMMMSLTGCASWGTPAPVVYITVTKYQEVPTELTAMVKPPAPTSKENYLSKTIYDRETYLADYSVQVLKSLHSCNAQLDSISVLSRNWKENKDESKQKD